MQKRRFKVLSPISKADGTGTWWMRVGDAFTNKDDSINVYLNAVPREYKFTLRELDQQDLERLSASKSRAVTPVDPTGTPF